MVWEGPRSNPGPYPDPKLRRRFVPNILARQPDAPINPAQKDTAHHTRSKNEQDGGNQDAEDDDQLSYTNSGP